MPIRKRKYRADVGPIGGEYEATDHLEILDLKEGDIKYIPEPNGTDFKIIRVKDGIVKVFYSKTKRDRKNNNEDNIDIFE
jgi:hypothetical protein